MLEKTSLTYTVVCLWGIIKYKWDAFIYEFLFNAFPVELENTSTLVITLFYLNVCVGVCIPYMEEK